MRISVIIPVLNERTDFLLETIESLKNMAANPADIEVILVDDCSSTPLEKPALCDLLIHNKFRCGGGASRHIGARAASGEILVFTDSHMLFSAEWDTAVSWISHNELMCGQMIGLDEFSKTLVDGKGSYYGAKMTLYNPSENQRNKILTAKWAKERHGEYYNLTAVMGALYAIPRYFFFKIHGLSMLRLFGHEEEYLSIKTMMAGGAIRMEKRFRAGHRFRSKSKPPYRIENQTLLYNTMLIAHTCAPPREADELVKLIGGGPDVEGAKMMIRQNWHAIAAEASYLQKEVFKLTWEQYVNAVQGYAVVL